MEEWRQNKSFLSDNERYKEKIPKLCGQRCDSKDEILVRDGYL